MAKAINVVIDISHHQENVDLQKIKDDGIVGVIDKASEGLSFVDRMHARRKDEAREAGLLWGAYHFGVGAEGSDQADFFLNTVEPDAETPLVLDYEPNVTGPTMSLN